MQCGAETGENGAVLCENSRERLNVAQEQEGTVQCCVRTRGHGKIWYENRGERLGVV